MKNKFSLSFGIALIAVGIFNIFIETNRTILFGMSISAFIFSLINILFSVKLTKKYEWVYIIPFIILLTFSCFSESLMNFYFVREIVNGKTTSVLTFLSFGLSFVSEYINGVKDDLRESIKHLSLVNESLQYSVLIQEKIVKYRKSILKSKKIMDLDAVIFVEDIEKLCNEKIKKASIESELLVNKKNEYTLDDFSKAYVKNNDILKYKK